ncbi:Uncharacterised protein [Klebsiella oxytoca]|nr:Uncharacterised protein [Klebsiella oxytoca]
MYDDITRIPLIMRPPQGVPMQIDAPVSHIDPATDDDGAGGYP